MDEKEAREEFDKLIVSAHRLDEESLELFNEIGLSVELLRGS